MTNDPYRIDQHSAAAPERHGIGALRTTLWTVLVISAAGNAATSTAGLPIPVSLAFGVVTVLCVAWLIADRFRRGRA
ncbi:hypothetical protein GCM10029978_080980 [Actinoallomurus acanthiterrae]